MVCTSAHCLDQIFIPPSYWNLELLMVDGMKSDIKPQGVWKCVLLDNTGRTVAMRPDYLEKADIETEPPSRSTLPLSLSAGSSVESASLRNQVKKGVQTVFGEWGTSAGIEKGNPPPYYPVR